MKHQALKTVSIVSLFVALSVSASNTSAFPSCPTCKQPVQYMAVTPVQNASPSTAAYSHPVVLDVFWSKLAMLAVSLF